MDETGSDHDNTWKVMERKAWKLSLTKRLYEQGYGREEVVNLLTQERIYTREGIRKAGQRVSLQRRGLPFGAS